ncbi:hypothetical protein [Shouchella patagoniensis]|uniref:hypothetical protein n=1 Tax=Shouchella patagoniensis TaxID=228576 RepID=UPI000994C51D|nr:hypothetical protein [Shouchella patagoniensis]
MSVELQRLTEKLLVHLQTPLSADDDERDKTIADVSLILESRNKEIQYTDPKLMEKADIEKLINQDKLLKQLLDTYLSHIKSDIKALSAKKQRRHTYSQGISMSYQSGFFIDKKSK